MTHADIVAAVEAVAPLSLQEPWDNSGWQIGRPQAECKGVMVCVDTTEAIIEEARQRGCNLIVCHHPVLFRAVRSLTYANRPETVAALALRHDIAIYAAHTSLDCAPEGINQFMAEQFGLLDIAPLDPSNGLGRVGNLPVPLSAADFAQKVKRICGVPALRCSRLPESLKGVGAVVSRMAFGGGACADLQPLAIAAGCQAMVTADVKLNFFLDHAERLWVVDAGHFETEQCAKQLIMRAIREKFRNFAVCKSTVEQPPVLYI